MKQREIATKQLLATTLEALEDGKAREVVSYDTEKTSNGLFSYILICTATSDRHGISLVNKVRKFVGDLGFKVRCEGAKDADWQLIDLDHIIVHIMSSEARNHYDLEELWAPIEE